MIKWIESIWIIFLYKFSSISPQIKKNKLIPIDKNKNEDCWINNGFYFPTMIYRSKDYEPKHSKTIRVAFRGIIGFYPGYDH